MTTKGFALLGLFAIGIIFALYIAFFREFKFQQDYVKEVAYLYPAELAALAHARNYNFSYVDKEGMLHLGTANTCFNGYNSEIYAYIILGTYSDPETAFYDNDRLTVDLKNCADDNDFAVDPHKNLARIIIGGFSFEGITTAYEFEQAFLAQLTEESTTIDVEEALLALMR